MNYRRMLLLASLAVGCIAALTANYFLFFNKRDASKENPYIAQKLLSANSKFKFKNNEYQIEGSVYHKITVETALEVQHSLEMAAARTGLPVNLLAAIVVQESTGDPKAEMRNSVQWRAAVDDRGRFAATDHGLVQISGRNLLKLYPNATLEEIKRKAENIDFAIEYMTGQFSQDLDWAKNLGQADKVKATPDLAIRANDPYWLAALAYNKGRNGAISSLSNMRACKYANVINQAWADFDKTGLARGDETRLATPFPPVVDDDPRLITFGDDGRRVEALQRLLSVRLSPTTSVAIDGRFGLATRDALKSYQKKMKLPENELVDLKAWEVLLGLPLPNSLDEPMGLVLSDIGPRVKHLQQVLNGQPSTSPALIVDGDFGRGTQKAILSYQAARSLPLSGAADADFWSSLGPYRRSELSEGPR